MHPVVLDQPYEFVPPYHGKCWPWLLRKFVHSHVRRSYGIEKIECEGIERLRQSLSAAAMCVV